MEMVVIHTKNSTAISYLFLTYTVRKKEEHSKKNSVSPRRSVRQTIIRRRTMASNKVVPFDDSSSSSKEEDVSEGSLSSGKKKMTKVEELLAKKSQIKALNSFNDNTGKRLRILRAQVHPPLHPLSLSSTPITFHHKQGPVVKIKDGVKDSFANILFGAAFAKALWATIHHDGMFAFHIILTLAGLGFATHDIVTEHSPLWMTLCAAAVFPWGIVSLLLLNSKLKKNSKFQPTHGCVSSPEPEKRHRRFYKNAKTEKYDISRSSIA